MDLSVTRLAAFLTGTAIGLALHPLLTRGAVWLVLQAAEGCGE